MSVEEHKAKAKRSIRCFVLTVSDTRDETTDTSGQLIKSQMGDEKHQLAGYKIVKDEPAEIESLLRKEIANPEVEAIIVNGGTGISPRDGTYEVIVKLLDKKLDGFGEIFRFLSYQDIGSAAIMSRAVAGSAPEQPQSTMRTRPCPACAPRCMKTSSAGAPATRMPT